MEMIELMLTTATIASAFIVLAIVDKKYQLGLNDLSGDMGTWTGSKQDKESIEQKNAEIESLKERVAVLEKLATDPAEQLKREINKLQ